MVTPADYNDNIHAALEAVINGAGDGHLHLPGRYVLTEPLKGYKIVDGVYKQVSFKLTGNYRFCGPGATLLPKFKDQSVIQVQMGKGVEIEGISVDGVYKAPVLDEQGLFNSDFATYGDPTCLDTRNKIYAGLCIDPDGDPVKSRSGSTGIIVKNCSFDNLTAGIATSINGRTQNAELLTYENIVIGTCKVGFVFGQAQEKLNRIINVKSWETIRRVFDWTSYGNGTPGFYLVRDLNLAGNAVELLTRGSNGYFPLHMSGVYAERLGQIGYWHTKLSDTLSESSINFNKNIIPDYHLGGENLTINNSDIRYYGLNRKVYIQANKCTLNNVPGEFIIAKYAKSKTLCKGSPVDGRITTIGTGEVGQMVTLFNGPENGIRGTGVIESIADGMITVKVSKSIKSDQQYYIQ